MNMRKTAGRFNGEVGVERVDRDGNMEVLENREQVEVTVQDRMDWYSRATIERDNETVAKTLEEERINDDNGGNNMNITSTKERTFQPRPHQFSIERRLEEQRDPDSTESIDSDADLAEAMAMTFKEIVKEVKSGGVVTNKMVVAMSDQHKLRIEDVFTLVRIAGKNEKLATRFAGKDKIPGEPGSGKEVNQEEVPGTKDRKPTFKKISDPEEEEDSKDDELQRVCAEVGLCD